MDKIIKMALKHKKRIYLSLSNDLLEYIEMQSNILDINKSQYIASILLKEYDSYQKQKIDKIIEGTYIL